MRNRFCVTPQVIELSLYGIPAAADIVCPYRHRTCKNWFTNMPCAQGSTAARRQDGTHQGARHRLIFHLQREKGQEVPCRAWEVLRVDVRTSTTVLYRGVRPRLPQQDHKKVKPSLLIKAGLSVSTLIFVVCAATGSSGPSAFIKLSAVAAVIAASFVCKGSFRSCDGIIRILMWAAFYQSLSRSPLKSLSP